MTAAPLRVLMVVSESRSLSTIESVVRGEGDVIEAAASVDEAVAAAAREPIDVAFVELGLESGAALALCHHLPSVRAATRVFALVQPTELGRGTEALSLGASGVLVVPPTGDAIARVLTDAKASAVRAVEMSTLEQKLVRERRRIETYDRLVRFARGAAPSDAVRAIVDGVAQLTSSPGVALYASFGKEETERVLLASLGSALDLPPRCAPADLSRLVRARQARVVPLAVASGEIGMLVLDRAPPIPEPEIAQLADLAAAMLSLVDRQEHVDESVRIFPPKHFRTVAERLLTLAERHDRRASVLAISIPGERTSRREEAASEIADLVRTTDALCGAEDGDLLLFLPETSGLGAHACRRRILARLHGERRARPKTTSASRASEPRLKGMPVAVGVATFPHDGAVLKRLVRTARARAEDDARSSVHTLGLDTLGLADLVDALIARPILDAGPRSPYPLDVAAPSLFSLVSRACREGTRGGETSILTTLQPGLGVAAAARQVTTPRVLDVRAEPGCENVEAIVLEAEHGAWVCCGRMVGDRFQGVHAADPLLADVVGRRLAAVGGAHAG